MQAERLAVMGILAVGLVLFEGVGEVRAGDRDGDGVPDGLDVCDNTPAGTAVDLLGRPYGDLDYDCDTDLDDYAMLGGAATGLLLDDFAILQNAVTGALVPGISGMAPIPGGELAIGCHAEMGDVCLPDELPVHDIYVDSFLMGIYEVTNAQYCEYLNSAYRRGLIRVLTGIVYKNGGYWPYCDTNSVDSHSRIHWDGEVFTVTPQKEFHPVVEVSWYGAAAYANWLSKRHLRTPCYSLSNWTCDFAADGYRLPTEAEWEYAARGDDAYPYDAYPWGFSYSESKANYEFSGDPYEVGPLPWTTPVGYYDGGQVPAGVDMANGYGLYDIAGNVWEWCHDWYDADYYEYSSYDNPSGPYEATYRVLRGGAWSDAGEFLRSAGRNRDWPNARYRAVGFRLVIRDSN